MYLNCELFKQWPGCGEVEYTVKKKEKTLKEIVIEQVSSLPLVNDKFKGN